MAIINPRTGKRLTDRQIKSQIQELTGWSTSEYQKKYDIIRNRLRNYQKVTGTHKEERVNEFIYKVERAKKKYGKDYIPSDYVSSVLGFTASSTGKVSESDTGVSGVSAKRLKELSKVEFRRHEGLIAVSKTAHGIVADYEAGKISLSEAEKRLKAYGDTLNAQRKNKIHGFRASVIYD